PTRTFSSTVSHGKSAKFWNTTAAPGWIPDSGAPWTCTVPEVGGMSPIRMRSGVDFPDPEGPRRATVSPFRREKSTSRRTTCSRPASSWYDLPTPIACAMGASAELGFALALMGSAIQGVLRLGQAIERTPDRAVEGDQGQRHREDAGGEKREVRGE